jgi:hypothetical protein
MALIQIKRGAAAGIPALADGEPGFTTDTHRLYVGMAGVNYLVGGPHTHTTADITDFAAAVSSAVNAAIAAHAADPNAHGDFLTQGEADALYEPIGGGGTAYTADEATLHLAGTQFSILAHGVGNGQLRQSAGLSVLGRGPSTAGDVADLTAANDGEVMRRDGAAVGFGAIDLANNNAVHNALPAAKGGTGLDTLTTHGVLIGQGTSAVAVTTAGLAGQPLRSGGPSANPAFSFMAGELLVSGKIALDEATTSATGAELATPDDITIDTKVTSNIFIFVFIETYNSSAAAIHGVTIRLGGAAVGSTGLTVGLVNTFYQVIGMAFVDNVAAGNKIIDLIYSTNAGTSHWRNRYIVCFRR